MKVKANELMIGNLLQGEPIMLINQGIYSDGVFAITGYGIHQLEEGKPYRADPIPLTKEWLVKFGFEKIKKGVEYSKWKKDGFIFWFDNLMPGITSLGKYDIVRIDRVHELQNLYFALTGNELEIKEP